MAYIYKIVNDVNQKLYIGMISRSVKLRWKEHQRDAQQKNFQARPLYRAILKYGIEHFHIELIEETDNPQEREKYWIEYYGSFKNGYNATIGGDGQPFLDYDILEAEYKETQNLNEVCRKYNCDPSNLSKVLKARKCKVMTNTQVNQQFYGKVINQYDKNGNYLKSFPSAKAAARTVSSETINLGGAASHIADVCKGRRKTAYGYIWRFAD